MESLILYIYPLTGIIGAFAYLPQIKALLFAQSDARDVSMASWLMWVVNGVILLAYGVHHLHDFMFTLLQTINVTLTIVTFALICYRRYTRQICDFFSGHRTMIFYPVMTARVMPAGTVLSAVLVASIFIP